jgi:hypothetical protein
MFYKALMFAISGASVWNDGYPNKRVYHIGLVERKGALDKKRSAGPHAPAPTERLAPATIFHPPYSAYPLLPQKSVKRPTALLCAGSQMRAERRERYNMRGPIDAMSFMRYNGCVLKTILVLVGLV